MLSASGDQVRALAAASEAVRLEPDNAQYRVARAQVLGQQGQFSAAAQEAEKALASSDKRPHVKARALCLLGDLYGSGRHPDYKRAMTYHSNALSAADALLSSPHPAIRIAAKEVLVNAHLGAAHDIAWGNWDRKEAAVPRWLEKAASLADDLVDKEGAAPERRFRVAVRALAALVGLQGRIEPTPWAERTVRSADELLGASTDPGHTQQLQWDLGMALYDTVQIYQMRGEHDLALKYGQKAIVYLEQGTSAKPDNADSYLLGRLYFRVGAIYAVGQQNHKMATTWYDKAVVIFDRLANNVNPGEFGRLGETYVSMGVSYWEIGQREKALDLTQRGTALIEKVVEQRHLKPGAWRFPTPTWPPCAARWAKPARPTCSCKRPARARKRSCDNAGRPSILTSPIGAQEFRPVEMNHVVGSLGNPDFRFPGDIRRILAEVSLIKEGRNIDALSRAFRKHAFQFRRVASDSQGREWLRLQ